MSCLLYLGNDVHLFWLDYMTQYVILKLGQIYICNMLISIFSWFFHSIFKDLTEQILYPKYNRMHLFASFWNQTPPHRFQSLEGWHVCNNTAELRSLELEGTVKICSSYRKYEPPVILERKKSGSDPGQFHYVMITDAQWNGLFS